MQKVYAGIASFATASTVFDFRGNAHPMVVQVALNFTMLGAGEGAIAMQSHVHGEGTAHLRRIAFGMRASQALYVAAKLGIADHLARAPMTGAELAAVTYADAGP